ncbi:putative Mg transporter [Trypanosoma grayi]|uniref:putative Mg transporter n=1 Tax=Trypanosoma grayi TaxID=71804 RepID=UPI0004F4B8C9|nr:putative Mg transporter [Trypanosoma grayi]KEG13777.1 putative Mg transporter [Trypanosoma grayi]
MTVLGFGAAPGGQGTRAASRRDSTRYIPRRDRCGTSVRKDDSGADVPNMPVGTSSSGGSTTLERSTESFLDSSTFTVARRRFVALAALLAMQSGSQVVLQRYEELLKNHVVIVLFLSMVVGAGGNAGNQAAVSVITALLATRENGDAARSSDDTMEEEASRLRTHAERERIITAFMPQSPRTLVGRSVWVRIASRLAWMVKLPRLLLLLLWRRWRRLRTVGERTVRPAILPIGAVLCYEALVGLCCGFILMGIGALRVGLFLWFDDDNEGDPRHMQNRLVQASWSPWEWSSNAALVVALSLSLFLIVFLSVVIGAMLPYALIHLNVDIEHAAPIVQVLMDLLGTWLCCATCSAFLPFYEGTKGVNEGNRRRAAGPLPQ